MIRIKRYLTKSIKITKGVIGFILLLVASFLQSLLMPILVIYAYIRILFVRDAVKRDNAFGLYNRDLALVKDVMGNVAGRFFFNDVLVSKHGYKFGLRYETISSALGKNKRINKLTWLGQLIAWILDKLDPEHTFKSLTEDNIVRPKPDEYDHYFPFDS